MKTADKASTSEHNQNAFHSSYLPCILQKAESVLTEAYPDSQRAQILPQQFRSYDLTIKHVLH